MPSEGDEAADAVAIDGKLLSLRKQSGTLRVVNGRGLRRGDTAICDFDAGAAFGAVLPARHDGEVNCKVKPVSHQLQSDVLPSRRLVQNLHQMW